MPDALNAISTCATRRSRSMLIRARCATAQAVTPFTVAPMERLRRFLVLGVDGATYYASARELTKDNAEVVLRMAAGPRRRAGRRIVTISASGRAPRNNPALFALAAAASLGDEKAVRLRWPRCPRSPGPAPTCSCSPATSSSSGAGAAGCAGPSAAGTCRSLSTRWRTRW